MPQDVADSELAGTEIAEPQARRPYGSADVGRSRHVLDGVLSPDGSFAVYQLSELAPGKTADEDRQVASLWRVDLAGGVPWRLTAKGKDAASPRFAPDGASVYFLSAREGAPQIWRLPLASGEAEPVTALEQGVAAFALSPDGASIAFTATEKPPKPPAPNDHVRIRRPAWRFDPIPGYLQDHAQAIHLIPAAGGEPRILTPFDGIVAGMDFSPDGQRIAAVFLGREGGTTIAMLGDLCVVDLEGRQTQLVARTAVSGGFWTSDGERVGYVSAPEGALSRQQQLFLVTREGGSPVSRTDSLDLAVQGGRQSANPAAAARSRVLAAAGGAFVTVAEGGACGIGRIALAGPQSCAPVVSGVRACKLLDLVGDKLLFSSQDFTGPAELWLADLATGEARALTDHNAALKSEIAWPKVERLAVESAPGVTVEGWAMLPPGERAPFKTVLFIHGGPHSGWGATFNEDFLEMVGAGWAVAFANPRGSTGYGDAFSTAILGCWGEPELEDFTHFVDALVARGLADPGRLAVTGVSGGGHLSAWLIDHTDRFKAAVPEQGVYDMLSFYGVSDAGADLIPHEMGGEPGELLQRYWDLSPVAHAHKCKTPTLLIQGENDVRCPIEQAEEMYTALWRAGCEVELLRLKGCNHGAQIAGPPPLRRARMAAIRDWLDRHVG